MGRKGQLDRAGRPGRPRSYRDGKALERAVEGYFAAISRTVDVSERVDSGQRDRDGHIIWREVPVKNDAGEIIRQVEYMIPPSVTGLCLHLGISRQTWCNYAGDAQYAPVVERARAVIQEYLERELLARRKGLQGVIFALQNQGSGWATRTEVEAGPRTMEQLAQSVPLEDKLALLKELFDGDSRGGTDGEKECGQDP